MTHTYDSVSLLYGRTLFFAHKPPAQSFTPSTEALRLANDAPGAKAAATTPLQERNAPLPKAAAPTKQTGLAAKLMRLTILMSQMKFLFGDW